MQQKCQSASVIVLHTYTQIWHMGQTDETVEEEIRKQKRRNTENLLDFCYNMLQHREGGREGRMDGWMDSAHYWRWR